ncbi:hypothetical protein A4S05_38210 [Nostoc sp. KVJ20]|nr:hypothetical protein A4S05_38210 [Nostoc sp. KVJ20]
MEALICQEENARLKKRIQALQLSKIQRMKVCAIALALSHIMSFNISVGFHAFAKKLVDIAEIASLLL